MQNNLKPKKIKSKRRGVTPNVHLLRRPDSKIIQIQKIKSNTKSAKQPQTQENQIENKCAFGVTLQNVRAVQQNVVPPHKMSTYPRKLSSMTCKLSSMTPKCEFPNRHRAGIARDIPPCLLRAGMRCRPARARTQTSSEHEKLPGRVRENTTRARLFRLQSGFSLENNAARAEALGRNPTDFCNLEGVVKKWLREG